MRGIFTIDLPDCSTRQIEIFMRGHRDLSEVDRLKLAIMVGHAIRASRNHWKEKDFEVLFSQLDKVENQIFEMFMEKESLNEKS